MQVFFGDKKNIFFIDFYLKDAILPTTKQLQWGNGFSKISTQPMEVDMEPRNKDMEEAYRGLMFYDAWCDIKSLQERAIPQELKKQLADIADVIANLKSSDFY